MTRYLLDTNVISSLMRTPHGVVREQMGLVGEHRLYTTIVVAAELRFGAVRKGSRRLMQEIEAVLHRIPVRPIESPLDMVYADLRSELERKGTPIGDADLWIAAQALLDESVLVTDNVREFGRVPKLAVENWLRS